MSEHKPMTASELRQFGLVTGALIIILIGGLLPWIWDRNILEWQEITAPIGGSLIIWALVHPGSLSFIYKPWMFIAEKIGWLNTRIILLLLFYVIILPIGLLMRLSGHDPMSRKFSADMTSYRVGCNPQSKDHMETPY